MNAWWLCPNGPRSGTAVLVHDDDAAGDAPCADGCDGPAADDVPHTPHER